MRGITDDERSLLNHISRWGSDGYPVKQCGSRHWYWDYRTIKGPPVVFPTRKQAVASLEAFLEILEDAIAGRI